MKECIIILGSNGQIGTELAIALCKKYGKDSIITSDIKKPRSSLTNTCFELINVLDKNALNKLFQKYKPSQIYLLAALLSADGEQQPTKAWELNMGGLLHVLDLAVVHKVQKVFWPSSIAVFGPHSPKETTPQYCIMDPNTVYGLSKLAGERWCEYYFHKYGLDVRSIRYPGLISWKAAPGGGVTDYAIDIFHEALKNEKYECYLTAETKIPMLYMDDAIHGTISLMDTPSTKLRIRSSYNISGFSLTPSMLADEIKKHIANFSISYVRNDPRQTIADSWPATIDDSFAQKDWNWNSKYTISTMTSTMLKNINYII